MGELLLTAANDGKRRVTRCAECPSPCASPRRRAERRRRCTPPSWFLPARMGALPPASRYTSPSTGARAACRCRPGRGRGTGCAWWSRRPTRTGALRRGARPRFCLHPVLPTPRLIVREPALLTGAARAVQRVLGRLGGQVRGRRPRPRSGHVDVGARPAARLQRPQLHTAAGPDRRWRAAAQRGQRALPTAGP